MSGATHLSEALAGDEASDIDREAVLTEQSRLLDVGLDATQVLDVYAVEVLGLSKEAWADHRDVSELAVEGSLKRARRTMEEHTL